LRQSLKDLYILKECKIGEPTSNIYLLNTCSEDGLVLVDTGLNFNFKNAMSRFGCNPNEIKHCLLTHGHFDHVDGCKELIDINPNIRFYTHINDAENTESIMAQYLHWEF